MKRLTIIKKVIVILFLVIFTTNTAKSQWGILANPGTPTSKGSITPTTTSQSTASFSPSGKVPYWTFSATAGVSYFFSLCSSTNTDDMLLQVFDNTSGSGNLVAGNDDYCGTKPGMTFIAPATQTYYVIASSWNGDPNFSNAKGLILTYYICGSVTPLSTPFSENWTTDNVTTACSSWMAHGAGYEGDWVINNAALGFAYGTQLAGGSGSEVILEGDQYDNYGIGVSKMVTLTSPPLNTNGTNTMQFSWMHTLQINGDNDVDGSNTIVLKLQSSNDLINWHDEWTGSYPVTGSGTYGPNKTTTLVNINTSGNVTTWLRFYFNGIPGKIAYWAIDNGTTGSIVLPIELTNFKANVIDTKTKLEWTTASETDNKYFTVERSLNGTDFTAIATVKGADNSTTTLNYNTFDEEPAVGLNYYRLKQTDFNGDFKYSGIESVTYVSQKPLLNNIHPNPATNNVSFNLYSPAKVTGNVQIIDITGRVISNELQNISEGNQDLSTSLTSLENGIYYLKVSIDELGYSHTAKIIKN